MGEAKRKAKAAKPFTVQLEPGSCDEVAAIDKETLYAVLTGSDAGDQAEADEKRRALLDQTVSMADRITRGAASLGLLDPETGEPWSAWRPKPEPKPIYGVEPEHWPVPTGRAGLLNMATGAFVENDYLRLRNLNILPGIGRVNKSQMRTKLRVYSALQERDGMKANHITASYRFTPIYDVRAGARRLTYDLSHDVWPAMRAVGQELGYVFNPAFVSTEVKYKGLDPVSGLPLFHIHAHALAFHTWMEADDWRAFLAKVHEACPWLDQPGRERTRLSLHSEYVAGDVVDEVVKYCFEEDKDNVDASNPRDRSDDYGRDLVAAPLSDEYLAVLSQELFNLKMNRKLGGFAKWARQFQPADLEERQPDGTIETIKKPAKKLRFVPRGNGSAVYVYEGKRVTRHECEGVTFDNVVAELPPGARGSRYRAPALMVVNYTGKTGEEILREWDCPTAYVDKIRAAYNATVPALARTPILADDVLKVATMADRPDEVPEVLGHPVVTVAPALEGVEHAGAWSRDYAAAVTPPAGFDRVERVRVEYDGGGLHVRCRAVWRVWRKAVTLVDYGRRVEVCGPAAPEFWYEELGGRFLVDFVTTECRVDVTADGRPCLILLKTERVRARQAAAKAAREAQAARRTAGPLRKEAYNRDNSPWQVGRSPPKKAREGPRAPPGAAA